MKPLYSKCQTVALVLLVVGMLTLGFAQAGVGAAAAIHPARTITDTSGAPVQRAFGGSVSSSFSCSNATCFAPDATPVGNLSLSWHYSVTWAVIYTLTNISATQVQIEVQAAIGISASIKISTCTNGTGTIPCQVTSFDVSVSGSESSNGYTNITNSTVDQTNASAGPTGSVPSWAIMNSWSKAALNFSGSYAAHIPLSDVKSESVSASFDVGGSETSSISFASPLSLVPMDPAAGDMWNSSAAYVAHGSYSNGSTFTLSKPGMPPETVSHWYHGATSPSGTLGLNGTDLGPITLYDNYTAPPTVVTAQIIDLTFSTGNYSAEDGWVIVPLNLFGGISSLTSLAIAHGAAPIPAVRETASSNGLNASSESAYYRAGSGFIGVGEGGNTSLPSSEPGELSPTVHVTAGPEPVNVALAQYQSITASPSNGGGFPLLFVAVAAVAAVVVIGGVLFWRRSSGRARPPASPPSAPSNVEGPTTKP